MRRRSDLLSVTEPPVLDSREGRVSVWSLRGSEELIPRRGVPTPFSGEARFSLSTGKRIRSGSEEHPLGSPRRAGLRMETSVWNGRRAAAFCPDAPSARGSSDHIPPLSPQS